MTAPPPHATAPPRRLMTIVALVALALYAVTLGGTLIYDDVALVDKDKRVASPIDWRGIWGDAYNNGVDNLYRPLVTTTYALQRAAGGLAAWPYHLLNILLHAATSAGVAWLAWRLLRDRGGDPRRALAAGWIAGLLFAVHPVHVEAVAGVVGRAESMCALATLGAIAAVSERLTPRRVAAAFACFVAAMLSKEQGFLVPAIVALFVWATRRERLDAEERPRAALLFALFAVGVAAMVVYREQAIGLKFWWDRGFLDPWIQPMAGTLVGRHVVPFPIGQQLATAVAIVGHYAALLVAPVTLRIDYGGPIVPGVTPPGDPYLWLGACVIVAWAAWLAIAGLRRDRATLATLLAFGLLYGMIANVVTLIGVNVAERLMYGPSVFFLIAVAIALSALRRRAIVAGVVGVACALYAVRTVTYAWQWNDRLRFYEYAMRVEPRSSRATLLAMDERFNRGDLDGAERLAYRALELRSDDASPYVRLARIAIRRGRLAEAEAFVVTARSINPMGVANSVMAELDALRAATRATTRP